MPQVVSISLLAVGVTMRVDAQCQADVHLAASAKQTIAMMRLFDYDLLIAGKRIPDMPVWSLMQRIRAGWPKQRWVFADSGLTKHDEIRARSLGAMMVLDVVPEWSQLVGLGQAMLKRRALPAADLSLAS